MHTCINMYIPCQSICFVSLCQYPNFLVVVQQYKFDLCRTISNSAKLRNTKGCQVQLQHVLVCKQFSFNSNTPFFLKLSGGALLGVGLWMFLDKTVIGQLERLTLEPNEVDLQIATYILIGELCWFLLKGRCGCLV